MVRKQEKEVEETEVQIFPAEASSNINLSLPPPLTTLGKILFSLKLEQSNGR